MATKKYVHPDGNPKAVLELEDDAYATYYEPQGWVPKDSPAEPDKK